MRWKWLIGYLVLAVMAALLVWSARHNALSGLPFSGYGFAALFLLLNLAALAWMQRHLRETEKTIAARSRELEQSIALSRLLKQVASAANEATSIQEGLRTALDSICEYTGWPVGHVYQFRDERYALASLGIWHMADAERYAALRRISEKMEFAPHEDFIGEIYSDSTPMWILDVAHSDIYSRKETAQACGIKSAFGFPISIGKRTVAVMEFYSPDAAIPDETLLSAMANIGKQMGQVIERAQFEAKAKLLETVITGANDSVIITTANLDSPGPEIIYVNEAFTKLTGYTAKEAIGQSPRFLQGEFTKQETLRDMRAALEAGQPFKSELLNYTKDHAPYWLDISVVPVRDSKGVITHYAAIERDISERKKMEMEHQNNLIKLKRANLKAEAATRDMEESLKKAEEANRAKSNFLANMSHELRTPMNGVLGMAHLLSDTALNEEQGAYVSTITGSTETLLMLLNDILDFSKIEAGALALENIPYSFAAAQRETANLLRPHIEKKQIELIVDSDPRLPDYIWGDPNRVRQVMTNLVGNSVKFTEKGYIRLSVQFSEDSPEPTLRVRVEDTGIGIPAEKLDTIFDKFTQADTSITRKYGGTGLGLAITKHLVGLMGGTIGVESAIGKGSTFWFTLPCRAVTAEEASRHAEINQIETCSIIERKPIAKAQALLVEDYPVNQLFAQKLLTKFGFKSIDLAANGVEALVKYRNRKYDIIFMDCQMPELDGYEATAKIRQLEQDMKQRVPIVAMTANAMVGDREKCLKAGMDDYISKPLKPDHLRTIIQTWFVLEQESPTAPVTKKTSTDTVDTQAPPVDMEQLRLFTDGNPDEEKALVEFFLAQAGQTIAELENHLAGGDKAGWKSASHRFKGASGNFGAMALHHLCKRAEAQHEDGEAAKREMLAAIKAETARVKAFFAA